MDLMSNMGEHQNKETTVRVIWEQHTTISPEKHDWFKEEGRNSLPEGEWAVAEPQRGMTQQMRRLQLARINDSETKFIVSPSHLSRGNK